jgi:hypothetical protein
LIEVTEETSPVVQVALTLIARAHRDSRWKAPITWWGGRRGSLESMAVQDLEHLQSSYLSGQLAAAASELYRQCIAGTDDDDHPGWREYVDDLAAAVARGDLGQGAVNQDPLIVLVSR